MYRGALGLIEVYGYLGAIEAADTALKSANVNLIGCEKVTGGLVTVKIKGDVSAVKAAVEAAEIAVIKLKMLVSVNVISRPDLSVWDIIDVNIDNDNKVSKHQESNGNLLVIESEKTDNELEKHKFKITNETSNNISKDINSCNLNDTSSVEIESINQEEKIQEIKELKFEDSILENSTRLREQLESKKVNELRTLARNLSLDNMTKKQIKFARKESLVEKLYYFIKGGINNG